MSDTRFVIVTPRERGKACRYLTRDGRWSLLPGSAKVVSTESDAIALCKEHGGQFMECPVGPDGIVRVI